MENSKKSFIEKHSWSVAFLSVLVFIVGMSLWSEANMVKDELNECRILVQKQEVALKSSNEALERSSKELISTIDLIKSVVSKPEPIKIKEPNKFTVGAGTITGSPTWSGQAIGSFRPHENSIVFHFSKDSKITFGPDGSVNTVNVKTDRDSEVFLRKLVEMFPDFKKAICKESK